MAKYTQANHSLAVSTPLGADVLLLAAFTGQEEMSRLFAYQLDMLSEKDDVAPADIVGKPVSWTVQPVGGTARVFSGVVSRFGAGGSNLQKLRAYRAEVVPWLWFLTLTSDCRIFQNKSAKDIIEQVFKDLGFTQYEFSLRTAPPKLDYCVQYRESDFAFVSRLLEENGIFYFFRHEKDKHTLVLSDQKAAYKDCVEKSVDFAGDASAPRHVTAWDHQYTFRPGKCSQTDYNFETPSTSLMTSTTTIVKLPGNDKYEMYDYPGLYMKKPDGDSSAKVHMEEAEVDFDVVTGASTCSSFTPGGKFTLKTHDSASERGKSVVVTAIRHSASDDTYHAGAGAKQEYRNDFTCIPDSVTFRPARLTPKPIVQGPQSAVVVGKKGEEIYVDKYGRVKVQFFWDRLGKKDENSSCWVRVAENWAGKNWGTVFLPRIGQEVLVDFLEGNPDRPIITGRFYNAEQMPPYELPTNQTVSVVKTRSSKGGGTDDFNELRFEDKKSSEEIYFHAQKDFNRVVENNDDLKVGSSKADDGSQTIEIYKDRTETVKTGDEKVTIEKGKRTHTVQQDEKLEVKQGNRTVLVDTGNDSHEVKQGNRAVLVDTGNDTHEIKQGNRTVTIDMGNDTLTIKMGNQTTKLNLGSSATEAMQSIELKVGQNSIKIDQTGVAIKGLMVKIEGQIQTSIKGLMTQVNGDAMLQLKGGITMIG